MCDMGLPCGDPNCQWAPWRERSMIESDERDHQPCKMPGCEVCGNPKGLHFESDFQKVGEMYPYTKMDEYAVKNEPMFFSASPMFAYINGGPLTRAFLSAARPPEDSIIDSRVHMLMKGWYPCIPGWHLDDIPRTRPDGQPDHEHPAYKSSNLMAIVGDASVTEFIVGKLDLSDIGLREGAVYGQWNARINQMLAQPNSQIAIKQVPERAVVRFGFGAFHRGVPATKDGWRFFIRANYNTARTIKNEIRRQTQVYLAVPEMGW